MPAHNSYWPFFFFVLSILSLSKVHQFDLTKNGTILSYFLHMIVGAGSVADAAGCAAWYFLQHIMAAPC